MRAQVSKYPEIWGLTKILESSRISRISRQRRERHGFRMLVLEDIVMIPEMVLLCSGMRKNC